MGQPSGSDAGVAGPRPVLAGLGEVLICVDHVGLAVPDLDAAIAFHTSVLGFRVAHRETNLDQQVEEAMLVAPETDARGAQLQLLAPIGPDGTIAGFLDRRGPGLQQLAVRVRNINLASELLRMRGVRLIYDSPRRGTRGSRINFVHPKDAGGVLIELVEPPGADSDGDAEHRLQPPAEKGNAR